MGIYRILRPDELMHHGILGMKWGVQNGPPYPLGSGDHSASEKKAGWQKSLDKMSLKEEKLSNKKKRNQQKIEKSGNLRRAQKLSQKNKEIDNEIEAIRNKKMSTVSQAQRLIGKDAVFKALGIESNAKTKKEFIKGELELAKKQDQYLLEFLEQAPDGVFGNKKKSIELYEKWLKDGVNNNGLASYSYDSWLVKNKLDGGGSVKRQQKAKQSY